MQILILDSIHGGLRLQEALTSSGHTVDLVDVYRGDTSHGGSIDPSVAEGRKYDLLIHPVHLNPAYPLLRSSDCPSITHHEAVRWILGERISDRPDFKTRIIEVSGARGKTTTATALAFLLGGMGILHTSRGTFRYPGERFITRMSITPASLIHAFSEIKEDEWLIGEVSLGFTGISDLAILTSDEDYRVAAGHLSAWEIKKASTHACSRLLVPPGVSVGHEAETDAGDLVRITGTVCRYSYGNIKGEFHNPLFILDGYRIPLQLACAAALLTGTRPDKLQEFLAIPGRLQIIRDTRGVIIDNANSGACLGTTREAISIIGQLRHGEPYSLVIGQEEHAVCENFNTADIITSIRDGRPSEVILVAGDDRIDARDIISRCSEDAVSVTQVKTRTEGIDIARKRGALAIVVSVKTWR